MFDKLRKSFFQRKGIRRSPYLRFFYEILENNLDWTGQIKEGLNLACKNHQWKPSLLKVKSLHIFVY
jgi:hypothetical protein